VHTQQLPLSLRWPSHQRLDTRLHLRGEAPQLDEADGSGMIELVGFIIRGKRVAIQ